MTKKRTRAQEAAFVEMNKAFQEISHRHGVGAAEAGVASLMAARWVMNTMIKSPYADFIAETLAATNRAVNYMQRVMAEGLDEGEEIQKLVKFGLPGTDWDHGTLEKIVFDRRRLVSMQPTEKWHIRDYDLDMEEEHE